MAYGIDHIRFKINKEGNRFMVETLKGIILRETPIGDYDKMMTVLTADGGKLSVFAKGAKRLKSPLFAATQLFSYTEMTLKKTGNTYYIRTGDLIENFYHIRDTLEGAALAGYIADIASDIAIEGQEAVELMRLVLNSFHLISTGKKPIAQIKAVFELRAAAIAGFMPNLVACAGCAESDLQTYYFDVMGGVFRCEECFRADSVLAARLAERQSENDGIYQTGQVIAILSPSVFAAMRHAVYSRAERIFSFELKDNETLSDFASVAEKYLICHMERSYTTLEFYHAVKTPLK